MKATYGLFAHGHGVSSRLIGIARSIGRSGLDEGWAPPVSLKGLRAASTPLLWEAERVDEEAFGILGEEGVGAGIDGSFDAVP